MDAEHRSPLRLIAPAAVVVFGLVLILVIATTGGSSSPGGSKASTQLERRDLGARKSGRHTRGRLPQNVYIVKRNDTFGSISAKTGVPVDTLQNLNPAVDPQTMHEGQKIKLR
jgi:LysM repeat protein